MSTLPTPLRRQLENAITRARTLADGGARKALEALAVHEPDAYRHMDETQQDLRRKLRAQAKQLGDRESHTHRGAYEIGHLVEKLAYDQWHRILFARFLLENNLLISPEHGVSVTLDDCEELAAGLGLRDAWAVAARFAAKELPEIFRADDPAGAVELPVEDRKQLIHLVMGLPVEVYTASDSLGWCYQFWQAERKREVNEAGVKIGADELPAVTQLFTEDYMVDFLLDNTLGAWHAGKVLAANPNLAESTESEEELRNTLALPGCPWRYLRFKAEGGKWSPAAGTFDGWPKKAKELKCLDPCMGSGHFVVAMFERLVALRIAEEQSDEAAAVSVVIRDNLFGLEIDQRCTQIAAFNLALAAWRRIGHCRLPALNLACSGLAPNTSESDWLAIVGNDDKLRNGMRRLYRLFKDAPLLGSLISPHGAEANLLEASYQDLQPLLNKALVGETRDDAAHEMTVTAQGLAKAAEILAGQFVLVATNVPYLGRGKQNDVLKDYCEHKYPYSKADLATCFVERCLEFCISGEGSAALVSPQNWWFIKTYEGLRSRLLTNCTFHVAATLGEEAWQSFGNRGPVAGLIVISGSVFPSDNTSFLGLNALGQPTIDKKMLELMAGELTILNQKEQHESTDHRISVSGTSQGTLLSAYAKSFQGVKTGDDERACRAFWELQGIQKMWRPFQSSPSSDRLVGGMELLLFWGEDGNHLARRQGLAAWGHRGVLISQMRSLSATLYFGDAFAGIVSPLVVHDASILAAIWAFCSSPSYKDEVRRIDSRVSISNGNLVNVPFDFAHWQKVATEIYPDGLPKPHTNDPTQWLFGGHPKDSEQPLHVGVARLLGYQWPRQAGSSFPDCPALGPDGLERMADDDGIVCLSATKGEEPAAERLRRLLVQALGDIDLGPLIASSGPKGSKCSTLEDWLRDEFLEQHCALFQQRPFIWHIWDAHKSGFSALVNYHKLTHSNLEKLTYAYLGDWIRRQQAAVDGGEAGSDARLQAAKQLQARLKLILDGEPPFDIFVRWKTLSKQAIGWHPDLNDGVRVNIRPFLVQDIPGGKRGAGILRTRPNIKWDKDRGSEPPRDKDEFPWFWGWDGQTQDFAGVGIEPDGNRWNDCHYTNDFKRSARQRASRNE